MNPAMQLGFKQRTMDHMQIDLPATFKRIASRFDY